MKKILLVLLGFTLFTSANVINECKVDLYYATDIILPEDEKSQEKIWKKQAKNLLSKYPQLYNQIGEIKVASLGSFSFRITWLHLLG